MNAAAATGTCSYQRLLRTIIALSLLLLTVAAHSDNPPTDTGKLFDLELRKNRQRYAGSAVGTGQTLDAGLRLALELVLGIDLGLAFGLHGWSRG